VAGYRQRDKECSIEGQQTDHQDQQEWIEIASGTVEPRSQRSSLFGLSVVLRVLWH
jgi:hypothetical protein